MKTGKNGFWEICVVVDNADTTMTKLLGCVYVTNSNVLKYNVKGYLRLNWKIACQHICILYSRWIHGLVNFQFWALYSNIFTKTKNISKNLHMVPRRCLLNKKKVGSKISWYCAFNLRHHLPLFIASNDALMQSTWENNPFKSATIKIKCDKI